MGIDAIDEVLNYVSNSVFKNLLIVCKNSHSKLENDIQELLNSYHDEGKEPNPMAKSMSWLKTNVKMAFDESDQTIADLITDGCNMGVKSLSKYLNQYKNANEKAKDIAKNLIILEENLSKDIRQFL